MLPFFTPFVVDNDKHTLKPYMAPVNHNILNETMWLNIVHTFMGNFCRESDNKNNTTPMEYMQAQCLCCSRLPQKGKCIYSKCATFSKMENTVGNVV